MNEKIRKLTVAHILAEGKVNDAENELLAGIMEESKTLGIDFDYWRVICDSQYRKSIIAQIHEETAKRDKIEAKNDAAYEERREALCGPPQE
jgi:arginyl-tRNA synthetase